MIVTLASSTNHRYSCLKKPILPTSETTMPTIIHFNIPADDTKRAVDFYNKLFGWNIQKFPGPLDYSVIETEDQDGNRGIGGGIVKREIPLQSVTNYIQVAS